jgi:hypothetical protein
MTLKDARTTTLRRQIIGVRIFFLIQQYVHLILMQHIFLCFSKILLSSCIVFFKPFPLQSEKKLLQNILKNYKLLFEK